MTIVSRFLIKFKTQHWTIFYYVCHALGLASATGIIFVSYLTHKAEVDTVEAFDLDLTHNVSLVFYVASGLILTNIVIGLLAQFLPDRPSLWILYCIVLTILSMVLLTASVSATSKSKKDNFPVARMKLTMEDYDLEDQKSTKWDLLQAKYKCCGTEGYKDWQDVHFGRTSLRVPNSCCLPKRKHNNLCGLNILPHDDKAHEKIYTRGCLRPALRRVQTMLVILSTMGLTLAAAELIIATFSCYLVVTKKI